MRMSLQFPLVGLGVLFMLALRPLPAYADSDPAHTQKNSEKPEPWPGGVIPYDVSNLTPVQQIVALRAMQRWTNTDWVVSSLPYVYCSIMHYRICWAAKCESECKDGVGSSPCVVIEPVDKQYDGVIGQWTKNGISALDAEKVRLVYGTR